MTPEVAQRLKEITVDVKTVTLPKAIENATKEAPKPASDLQTGSSNYKASIALNGQSMPLSVKSETKDENGNWTAVETVTTPQGDIVDSVVIEKKTHLLKHRTIKQGPLTIEFDVKGNKVTGTSSMNGQATPIDVDLGGPIFADGAGAFDIIGTLPLAEGYSTSFINFDTQKLKPQIKQLKVLGIENVSVPGGKFDTYKVEIVSLNDDADKQIVWIAKDSRKVVKINATLPSMGGAVLTSELVP
jgi:hypothetical protein